MSKYAGFNSVQLQKPKKSMFDLSATKRSSTRAGRLTPVFIAECIPSDVFRGSSEILVRLAPLLAPIYDQLRLYVHFFFVPNRLIWAEWEKFITGGQFGVSEGDPAPIPPYFAIGGTGAGSPALFGESSLADYLGVPIFQALPGFTNWASYNAHNIDAMPFLVYQCCWYHFYRDRNFVLDNVMSFPVLSGPQAGLEQYLEIQTRAWGHEYYTSALPFTQRGEEVLMPMAGTASVSYLDNSLVKEDDGTPVNTYSLLGSVNGLPGQLVVDKNVAASGGTLGRIENIDEVSLDGSDVSINDFRTAYALQVWLERNAIGGSRYNESTQAHFGVKPQDSRLQRPEYIGGGQIPIKISEVVSTAYSSDGTDVVPLANMAGHGVSYGNTNGFNYFCVEHGFIIGIASIMSERSYHQGLPRMFRRRSFLDYPWPTFAKLGEQQIDKVELFASPANFVEDADGQVPLFGYISRYADWKYIPNTNHGLFHSTLLFWTLTTQFGDSPDLGEEFTKYEDAVQDRIFAVNGGEDNFWLYIHNKVTVRRPLPYFGTPNTLGFV